MAASKKDKQDQLNQPRVIELGFVVPHFLKVRNSDIFGNDLAGSIGSWQKSLRKWNKV